MTGATKLARRVFEQAFVDVVGPNKDASESARSFLTKPAGEFGAWRDFWMQVAEWDPPEVHQQIAKVMEQFNQQQERAVYGTQDPNPGNDAPPPMLHDGGEADLRGEITTECAEGPPGAVERDASPGGVG